MTLPLGTRAGAILALTEQLTAEFREGMGCADSSIPPAVATIVAAYLTTPAAIVEMPLPAAEPEPAEPQREFLSRAEAAEFLGIGLSLVAEMCRDGRIRSVKFGTRRLIRRSDLVATFEAERRAG